MLEITALALAIFAVGFALGYGIGAALADRKNRRENAATARCFTCEWEYGAGTLSEAFGAVERHTATEQHRAMVVRA